jgi:quinol monooxygenase YgiN
MLIYEVNLQVEPSIFNEFLHWLKPHIRDILQCKGFLRADLYLLHGDTDDLSKKITVSYQIDHYENYERYINTQSQTMRHDGQQKFPGKFTAERRLLELLEPFSKVSTS